MEDDKTKVKCTLCSSVISRGGTGRTASTSGMTNHLKLKHKDQLPETSSTSVSAPEHSFDHLLHVIVRDNGPNMVKAIKESAFEGKGCFIHTLQLAIKAALEVENVSDALISARRIVTHFNHSSTAQQKLKDIQKELHLTEHQLVQDVTTRWNSTYYMLERVVEQKRAISLYISDNSGSVNIRNCTERQWQILKECLILLKPFEEITKITSSTFSTISEVIPHSNTLIKYLTKPEISEICSNIPEMVQKLREEVQCRFKNLEEDKYYCLSTLLDPRFRTRFFAQENYELVRRKLFLEAIQRSDLDAESSSEDEATNRGRPPQNVSNFLEESHVTFWNCYEELASTNPVISEDPKSPIAVELNNYESESLLPRNQSPFDWWAKHKSKYAHLANLARVFLSAPGSSVYSERLFSEAGNLYEEKRNRLLPERAESLVFLHHNLPLINYKY
ncbi:unnamed protein product [Spodoptera littoralis]|uniref:BED-type domain-containing protein n=1 Tax=Spodoptera littoralis TaxID=7109 RepID=A0A9P0IJA3_SPOLI|nr:unnamed protein product [Spodoptera littoralis]CAH1646055.1 unnamed protein product [Spodoptera littoralis]